MGRADAFERRKYSKPARDETYDAGVIHARNVDGKAERFGPCRYGCVRGPDGGESEGKERAKHLSVGF